MDFLEAMPITFKEITPNHRVPEKWKEVVLNTGGTHSTLQDIKLPPKAGGYWYNNSKKANIRNRFLYWQTTPDAIEFSEASLDLNLSSANLRCKVAPGTPPLNGMSVSEQTADGELIILAATVSSVHRLIFPHPDTLDQKATFGSLSGTSPSIFCDTTSINNPNNYFILNQYSSASTGVAHTCASLLRDSGEAVFALAYGYGGEGGILLVKLPAAGPAVTYQLKRESTVPRFLSGITGALRGKAAEGIETYGVVVWGGWAVAVCGDACLRAWPLDDGGAPAVVSPPLSQAQMRPKPPPHGHMLQKAIAADGSVILVVFLSFPNECEFVVLRMHDGVGGIKFSNICRIFGPQLDLLDYTVGYGDDSNVIWALWSQSDGETVITSSSIGAEAMWRCVAGSAPAPSLPQLSSHQQYRDRLLAVGLFPPSVIRKALVIYRRTWGGAEGVEPALGEAALSAVAARCRQLAARTAAPDHAHLMHKCWSDLYSWCLQYMEGLQKPLGIMVSKQACERTGWWAAVIRRAGVSLVRELEPLERMLLSPDALDDCGLAEGGLSADACRVVLAGAAWERRAGEAAAAELERRVFACAAPQHRLLPRLTHLPPVLTPEQIDELSSMLEPIRDLQSAVLELNDALRLDVPEIDTSKDEDEDTSEYDNLFSSELGVSIVTEAIRQMAEIRSRIVRGALAALGTARGADAVPGAGHCAVHWQAYRALAWLRAASDTTQSSVPEELFRLKLSSLGLGPESGELAGGVVAAYVKSRGAARARAHLAAAQAPLDWQHALPLVAYHVAHQLWAVSGGFEFGCWLAAVGRPRLVQSYVALLEPWCEWNACSRQFILGLALLDLEDAEGAYSAFSRAAKGVGCEPFLRRLVEQPPAPPGPSTQHRALVQYYMKVIKLFEIHDAGACVVRLAETAISIADKDDPNLAMFQWVVFKWHLAEGRVDRALAAAAASPAPNARRAAAATLLTTLASRKQLGALVTCSALAAEAERAAAARAKLHDAHTHNPYYDFLYALHVHRQHYRKASAVMYERAARCGAEGGAEGAAPRRRYLAAALAALRLARPDHAFLARPPAPNEDAPQVIGPEELAAEFREEDPDSADPVQQALLNNETVDFVTLYPELSVADAATLRAVTRRALGAAQTFPHWFLQRYLEVDSGGCVRALLAGGRAAEAARCCGAALRDWLRRLTATAPAPPRLPPLAAADLLMAELRCRLDDPICREAHEELEDLIKEYSDVVVRTSDDMKLARIEFPIASS